MTSPEWLIERGIGEDRAVLVEAGEIVEARIALDGLTPAGSVIAARLASTGTNGRNAIAIGEGGVEYLLPHGAPGVSQGATLTLEVTREAIPGREPWKRPLARVTEKSPQIQPRLHFEMDARELIFPAPADELERAGWDDLLDEARTGVIAFAGGELRIDATAAMTLIDVDGYLAPEELAVLGASEAARAIRRLDIGGSIGIDLPTVGSKAARQAAGTAVDHILPQPFERTAVNGFGFIQIVRPRSRASLVELAQDRAAFEARALLRRVAFDAPGPKRLVVHPSIADLLEHRRDWIAALAGQVGGAVELRRDTSVAIYGGYAEAV
ncbi:MAG TPA: ribonuclease [Sphingomicrobium sp.]|nr:ribonuclease [Sphingomicrobium sp.]